MKEKVEDGDEIECLLMRNYKIWLDGWLRHQCQSVIQCLTPIKTTWEVLVDICCNDRHS